MPKIKARRVGVAVDMTPLVDVAFLLLTFFMLTTQFKPPEELEVQLPDSHSAIKLPEKDVMSISFDKEGRVFLGVDKQADMEYIFQSPEARYKSAVQIDSLRTVLPELLIRARMKNPKLRTVIRGDIEADYGVASDIMDALQKTQITRFAMVTNTEMN